MRVWDQFVYLLVLAMNFFFLDRDPVVCARFHGDKHLNKMLVEYAQICSFVWHIVFFDVAELSTEVVREGALNVCQIYKRGKSHLKHPVVLWAAQSRAHYMAIAQLGLALADEKRRRIDAAFDNPALTAAERKRVMGWKRDHQSEPIMRLLHDNPPPAACFAEGVEWVRDPPKCMPEYLHARPDGTPYTVMQSYRLFYAINKVQQTGLKWSPWVEEPSFVAPMQRYVAKRRPDINEAVRGAIEEAADKKVRTEERRAAKKLKV